MKPLILALSLALLLSAATAQAAEMEHRHHGSAAAAPAAALSAATEGGSFLLEVPAATALKTGPNALELKLRDRGGHTVEGARIVVTPWMPSMGHGVWDKPVVTERGAGNYRVENVMIIMGGEWELKIAVQKGAFVDRGALRFTVAEEKSALPEPVTPRSGYTRTQADYNVPNVTLLNQDGKRVNLRALIDSGKPVVVDFIFTTCTTICPVLSAGFANLRRELGEDADKVQLVSITIDPDHDRPEQLKRYWERFDGGPGWEFLTGSREDVGRVLRAFNAFVVDKMSHEPLYLLRGPDAAQWVRLKGLSRKSDLVAEFRRIATR